MGEFPPTTLHPLKFSTPLGPVATYLALLPLPTVPQVNAWAPLLASEEQKLLATFPYPKRRQSFVGGRLAARRALSALLGTEEPGIAVLPGVFSQPVVSGPQAGVQVSLAHDEGFCGAVAFPESCPVGLDIQKLRTPEEDLQEYFTQEEQITLASRLTRPQRETLLWTAKEGLAKVLKTGLTVSFSLLETTGWKEEKGIWAGQYVHFPQYTCRVVKGEDEYLALTYPSHTTLTADWTSIGLSLKSPLH